MLSESCTGQVKRMVDQARRGVVKPLTRLISFECAGIRSREICGLSQLSKVKELRAESRTETRIDQNLHVKWC